MASSVVCSDEESTSLIYAVLPPLIKRSVPKVRSLRRSLSGYSAAALVGIAHTTTASTDNSRTGSTTPPPPYQDAARPLTSVLSDDDDDDDESFEGPSKPVRPLALDPSIFADSERAGIKWEFASQGNYR